MEKLKLVLLGGLLILPSIHQARADCTWCNVGQARNAQDEAFRASRLPNILALLAPTCQPAGLLPALDSWAMADAQGNAALGDTDLQIATYLSGLHNWQPGIHHICGG